jgi:energy-coupling factor transport system ATP-binding protein
VWEKPLCCPERAADLLLTTAVAADCALNDRARRLPRGATWGRIQTISDGLISPQQHPHDLSTGQQLLVALAIQTAHNPEHLMVDEPTRGLDANTRDRIVEVVHHLSEHRLVTIATHDTEFVSQLSATIIPMPTRESVDERTVASAGVTA